MGKESLGTKLAHTVISKIDPPLRRRVVIVNNKSQTNMHAVIFSNLIGPCYCYSVAEVVLMLESI